MSVVPELYVRKPFEVEAVCVTEDNINDVSDWCDGEVRSTAESIPFVKVKVHRPLTTRQTRAFVGDWILFAGRGFKVYTQKAFETSFEKADENAETGNLIQVNPSPEVQVNV